MRSDISHLTYLSQHKDKEHLKKMIRLESGRIKRTPSGLIGLQGEVTRFVWEGSEGLSGVRGVVIQISAMVRHTQYCVNHFPDLDVDSY